MAASRANDLVEYLRRTVLLQDGAGLSDGQLLERFIERSDEAALAALVRRHGPMVWSVCRRALGDHHDAEDAFQATFLVLVRRAASVKPREMVANWLYGVASQTARKAKETTAKRRARESQPTQLPEPAVPEPDCGNDLHHRLHQALAGLPDKFRAPIILCYLEDKTRTEAARQLGVPEGTLASWLARGRVMLAKRLARHGLTLSAGALTAALVQTTASASMPVSLTSSTLRAVALLATGQAVSGVLSTRVVALMEGVMNGMLATKVKITTTVLLAVILTVGLGSGALAYRMQTAERETTAEAFQSNEQQNPVASKVPPEQPVLVAKKNADDEDTLIGSGKEGKKEIQASGFDALDLRMPIQVSVKQGKTFSVVLTGDDNLLEVIKADKEGSTLQFAFTRRSWRTSHPLKAAITMPALERVHLNSASRMTIQDFKSTKDFTAKVAGASSLEGSIKAKNVKLDASGASKMKLKGSADLKVTLTGASHLEGSIDAKNVKLDASGASQVKLSGSATKAALSASGACNLQLGDFALETADVKLAGACTATINIKTKLDYSLSGACKLRYQGNPTIGKAHSSGASSLRRGIK